MVIFVSQRCLTPLHRIIRRILGADYDPYKDGTGVFKLKGVNIAQPLTNDGEYVTSLTRAVT